MKPWIAFAAFFITLNTLFFYGFVRDGTWLVIAILLILLYRRIGHLNFFLASLSFLFITTALIFLIDFGFPQFFYWRAYERLTSTDANGLGIYKKNQDIRMHQAHGDLKVAAGKLEVFDLRPRDVSFKTDSLGFRNDADYNGEKYILTGDSFIAGSSNGQEDILSAQLKNKFNVEVYNVAFPGTGILDYVKNIQKFESLRGGSFKTLLFFFEGNDFQHLNPPSPEKTLFEKVKTFHKEPIRRYKSFFKQYGLYRYTFSAYKAITHKASGEEPQRLFIGDVGAHKTAFLLHDMNATLRKDYSFPLEIAQGIESVKERIDTIFFIPEKFRVYYAMIDNNPYPPLTNVNWEALQSLGARLGIPTVNLTEPLVAESRRLLEEENAMTFWEDDSHWNARGAAVAAEIVCRTVADLGCSPLPAR